MFVSPYNINIFNQAGFAGMHLLFVARVGFKHQKTTSASLVLKCTVCVQRAKFVLLRIMLLPRVHHRGYEGIKKKNKPYGLPKGCHFQSAVSTNTPCPLNPSFSGDYTFFSKQPKASASSMATSFLQ